MRASDELPLMHSLMKSKVSAGRTIHSQRQCSSFMLCEQGLQEPLMLVGDGGNELKISKVKRALVKKESSFVLLRQAYHGATAVGVMSIIGYSQSCKPTNASI